MVNSSRPAPLQHAYEARLRALEDSKQSRTEIAPGVVVYKDISPGVGWVLDRGQGSRLKYLATKDMAIGHFERIGMGP